MTRQPLLRLRCTDCGQQLEVFSEKEWTCCDCGATSIRRGEGRFAGRPVPMAKFTNRKDDK